MEESSETKEKEIHTRQLAIKQNNNDVNSFRAQALSALAM